MKTIAFKKVAIIAFIIFLLNMTIFITANARNFEFGVLLLWLILNSCIIAIIILSFLKKISKTLLAVLSGINFLPALITLIGIGLFNELSHLLIYWIVGIGLNIFLFVLGIKKEQEKIA